MYFKQGAKAILRTLVLCIYLLYKILLFTSWEVVMKITKKCHNLAFKKLGGRYEDTQEMPQSCF